ncbi:MAG: protein-tyrosine-phosphatase [Flavobacteriaceae bacterium]|nr:protein-tyrosine-phosphatase [Flavobacteriaceae bacterium]
MDFEILESTIQQLKGASIPEERKETLLPLVDYMQKRRVAEKPIRLNFICTHNSRRSHLGQVWAQTMAYYFGIKRVYCYSGGTEETAMYPKVAETLVRQGFAIAKLSEGDNPVYAIKCAPNAHPIIAFSKKYDTAFNPSSGFAAIMTCAQADEGCPFIPGAEVRLPIRYEDPKAFDYSPEQELKYLERSIQIASELYFVFSSLT